MSIIMKRLHFNLLALLILLSCGQLWAQEQVLPYKSRAMFKEDTLQYLKYNHDERGKYYMDKTVGELLDELEYPVLYVSRAGRARKLIELHFYIQQVCETPHELTDDYLIVSLGNPPNPLDFKAVYDRENPSITPKLYEFIKDLKISNVSLWSLPREDLKRLLEDRKKRIKERQEAEAAEAKGEK